MQAELKTSHPGLEIHIYGINLPGFESGVDAMVEGNTIGLVQDTTTADVFGAWGATYRDVYILDENNEVSGVYNLTTNSLGVQANYDTLKQMFIDEATD